MIRVFFYLDVMLTAAELTGPNVCFKGQTRAKVCCSDFEERNNRCIKCLSGFTSASGQYCVPCKEERFGDRCIKMCVCKVDERCDHVNGCVPVETVTNTSFDRGFNYSTNTEQNNEVMEEYNILVYSLVTLVILLSIGIGLAYVCFRQKTSLVYNLKKGRDIKGHSSDDDMVHNDQHISSEQCCTRTKKDAKEDNAMFDATAKNTDNEFFVDLENLESNSVIRKCDKKKEREFQTFRGTLSYD